MRMYPSSTVETRESYFHSHAYISAVCNPTIAESSFRISDPVIRTLLTMILLEADAYNALFVISHFTEVVSCLVRGELVSCIDHWCRIVLVYYEENKAIFISL